MITILGGGLSGLICARVLSLHRIPCVVLDADASATSRHQGGMLDMHEESGQAALRSAGLFQEFQRHVLPEGDATRLIDAQGNVLFADSGGHERPEIDRAALRTLLVESLPPGVLQWGQKVKEVRRVEDGHGRHDGYELVLADGRLHKTELLVGADGAWSKVRSLLTPAMPRYSGISFVESRVLNASKDHPELVEMAGAGMLFALAEGKGFLGHREPGDEICAYAALQVSEGWTREGITTERVLAHFDGWHPALRAMIAEHDGELVPRAIHLLPAGLRWDRVPGVTLLGDAAHLMSPFAGEGANLALLDGAELAQALVRHPRDPEAALVEYEQAMFERSARAAQQSAEGLELCFGKGAPYRLAEFFKSGLPPGVDAEPRP